MLLFIDSAKHELRCAFRIFRRHAAFSILSVVALGIGIGMSVAVFSMIEAVVLRPFPYSDPTRLVVVREAVSQWHDQYSSLPVNARHFFEWQKVCSSFIGLAAIRPTTLDLSRSSTSEQLGAALVSANLFSVLGVRPLLGRDFVRDEDTPGNDHVVIITDALWRRDFGGESSLVGRRITLSNSSYVVIGVLPPSFRFPKNHELGSFVELSARTDVFKPLGLAPEGVRPVGGHNFAVIGRLRPMVTKEQATANLNAIQANISRTLPERIDLSAHVIPLQEQVTGASGRSLWMLFIGVLAVLLIVCMNCGILLMARTIERTTELAVKQALGAGRLRLIAGTMLHCVFTAGAGWGLGLLIAKLSLATIIRNAPVDLPRIEDVGLNGIVVAFSVIVTAAISLIFAGVPVLRIVRSRPYTELRNCGAATSGYGWGNVRILALCAEVAISSMLLMAGALLVHAFIKLTTVDLGFREDNLLVTNVLLPSYRYKLHTERFDFYTRAIQQISALPGVNSVGMVSTLPLEGEAGVDVLTVPGDIRPESERPLANFRYISPDYFKTIGILLYRGRAFYDSGSHLIDGNTSCYVCGASSREIILSGSAARMLWNLENPIGKQVLPGNINYPVQLIGLAADTRTSMNKDPTPIAYLPYWVSSPFKASLVVQTTGNPSLLAASLASEIRQIDRQVLILQTRTMREVVTNSLARPRYVVMLVQLFALVALMVAALGIFGTVSYFVALRCKEVALRLALGARKGQIYAMIVRQSLAAVAVGLVTGILGIIAIGRPYQAILFGVGTTDPSSIGIVVGIQLFTALAACALPAIHAVRQDPAAALRYE